MFQIFFVFRSLHPIRKNAIPNIINTTNDSHGNAVPRLAALMHSLACVNGRQYNNAWKNTGKDDTEKNVPHRNVIGSMTTLLKVAML